MTRFPVSATKEEELIRWMEELKLYEEDIIEKFIRGSGSGGQKINTSANCVWLKHEPTGIEVKCQAARSRAHNRFTARRSLCKKLDKLISGKKSKAEQAREKIRRQKRKRSKRAKEKILKDKQAQSKKKESRKKVKTNYAD